MQSTSGFDIHTVATAPAESKETLIAVQAALGGALPNLHAVLAGSPAALKAAALGEQLLGQTSLSPYEVNIVSLAVSHEHECAYCIAAHSFSAKSDSQPMEHMEAAREGRQIDEAKAEALRRFAVELVQKHGFVSKATREQLLEAGYTHAQQLDIILAVTQKTLHNLVNNLSGHEIDSFFLTA